ncbi:unnamed protein product [Closterium sp. NIES-65]|nr:unnamed protein product [Closterium sp. NIES-65]
MRFTLSPSSPLCLLFHPFPRSPPPSSPRFPLPSPLPPSFPSLRPSPRLFPRSAQRLRCEVFMSQPRGRDQLLGAANVSLEEIISRTAKLSKKPAEFKFVPVQTRLSSRSLPVTLSSSPLPPARLLSNSSAPAGALVLTLTYHGRSASSSRPAAQPAAQPSAQFGAQSAAQSDGQAGAAAAAAAAAAGAFSRFAFPPSPQDSASAAAAAIALLPAKRTPPPLLASFAMVAPPPNSGSHPASSAVDAIAAALFPRAHIQAQSQAQAQAQVQAQAQAQAQMHPQMLTSPQLTPPMFPPASSPFPPPPSPPGAIAQAAGASAPPPSFFNPSPSLVSHPSPSLVSHPAPSLLSHPSAPAAPLLFNHLASSAAAPSSQRWGAIEGASQLESRRVVTGTEVENRAVGDFTSANGAGQGALRGIPSAEFSLGGARIGGAGVGGAGAGGAGGTAGVAGAAAELMTMAQNDSTHRSYLARQLLDSSAAMQGGASMGPLDLGPSNGGDASMGAVDLRGASLGAVAAGSAEPVKAEQAGGVLGELGGGRMGGTGKTSLPPCLDLSAGLGRAGGAEGGIGGRRKSLRREREWLLLKSPLRCSRPSPPSPVAPAALLPALRLLQPGLGQAGIRASSKPSSRSILPSPFAASDAATNTSASAAMGGGGGGAGAGGAGAGAGAGVGAGLGAAFESIQKSPRGAGAGSGAGVGAEQGTRKGSFLPHLMLALENSKKAKQGTGVGALSSALSATAGATAGATASAVAGFTATATASATGGASSAVCGPRQAGSSGTPGIADMPEDVRMAEAAGSSHMPSLHRAHLTHQPPSLSAAEAAAAGKNRPNLATQQQHQQQQQERAQTEEGNGQVSPKPPAWQRSFAAAFAAASVTPSAHADASPPIPSAPAPSAPASAPPPNPAPPAPRPSALSPPTAPSAFAATSPSPSPPSLSSPPSPPSIPSSSPASSSNPSSTTCPLTALQGSLPNLPLPGLPLPSLLSWHRKVEGEEAALLREQAAAIWQVSKALMGAGTGTAAAGTATATSAAANHSTSGCVQAEQLHEQTACSAHQHGASGGALASFEASQNAHQRGNVHQRGGAGSVVGAHQQAANGSAIPAQSHGLAQQQTTSTAGAAPALPPDGCEMSAQQHAAAVWQASMGKSREEAEALCEQAVRAGTLTHDQAAEFCGLLSKESLRSLRESLLAMEDKFRGCSIEDLEESRRQAWREFWEKLEAGRRRGGAAAAAAGGPNGAVGAGAGSGGEEERRRGDDCCLGCTGRAEWDAQGGPNGAVGAMAMAACAYSTAAAHFSEVPWHVKEGIGLLVKELELKTLFGFQEKLEADRRGGAAAAAHDAQGRANRAVGTATGSSPGNGSARRVGVLLVMHRSGQKGLWEPGVEAVRALACAFFYGCLSFF